MLISLERFLKGMPMYHYLDIPWLHSRKLHMAVFENIFHKGFAWRLTKKELIAITPWLQFIAYFK
jgi:hypothetical protein